jgi:hypothetical protein
LIWISGGKESFQVFNSRLWDGEDQRSNTAIGLTLLTQFER